MKIKKGFILKELDGQVVAIPVASEFSGVVKMNEIAAFLWKKLEKGATKDELVAAVLSEYEATPEQAREAVESTLATLKKNGFIED
ncbi:MAG: PqqD family protein [Candidatus Coproplasma sp.]